MTILPWRMPPWLRALQAVLRLALLMACAPVVSPANAPTRQDTINPVDRESLAAGKTYNKRSSQAEDLPPPQDDRVRAEEPLRFTFPASANPPISAWRPALYPVPWALTPFDHFYFLRPIQADEINWPLADYRYGGVFFEDVVHSGVDITAPLGTPVLASAAGKVTWAGYGLFNGTYDPEDPYGIAVMIRHDFGFQGARLYTVYAHLSRADVVKGERVEAGMVLGVSGETGKATGPHLHFEVRQEVEGFFSTYNPELWLVPPQGWGVLAGRVMNTGGLKLKGQLVEVLSPMDGRVWKANTYGGGNTHEDPFYRENVVIGDLPAGRYEVKIRYLGKNHTLEVDIQPGLVTYFTFRGWSSFTTEPLILPGADFDPLSTINGSN